VLGPNSTDSADYVLPTSTGRKHSPSNLRRDVLRPAIETANAALAKDGIAAIEPIGFHGLRRTYASLRCAVGDDVAYTSAQLGRSEDNECRVRRSAQLFTPLCRQLPFAAAPAAKPRSPCSQTASLAPPTQIVWS
jgi:hypothetical protein